MLLCEIEIGACVALLLVKLPLATACSPISECQFESLLLVP